MKDLLNALKLLLLDLASTLFFLILFLLSKNLPLAVALGMALGVAQIGWELARKKPIDTMQWVSLVIVVASGTAALVTHDARFVMLKPTVIYVLVGVAMLKSGWMNRYQPPIAMELMPDLVTIFGFVWSGLMFFSAGLNLVVAFNYSVTGWASFMSAYGIASKLGLFAIQYAVMRFIGVRRGRARRALSTTGVTPTLVPSPD
jgi:intracellular septation protein